MIRLLLKEVKEYKKASIATPLFMILEVAMEMCVPFLMASIIDNGVDKGDMAHIYKVGAIMIVAAAIGLFAGLMGTTLFGVVAVPALLFLRKNGLKTLKRPNSPVISASRLEFVEVSLDLRLDQREFFRAVGRQDRYGRLYPPYPVFELEPTVGRVTGREKIGILGIGIAPFELNATQLDKL